MGKIKVTDNCNGIAGLKFTVNSCLFEIIVIKSDRADRIWGCPWIFHGDL